MALLHRVLQENQVAFEQGMTLNMGQLLSIPMIIAGIVLMVRKPGPAAVAAKQNKVPSPLVPVFREILPQIIAY